MNFQLSVFDISHPAVLLPHILKCPVNLVLLLLHPPVTSSHQVQDVQVESGVGEGEANESQRNMVHSEDSNHEDNMAKMIEMFPHLNEHQLKYLFDLSGQSISSAINCALEGPSLKSLRSLAVKQLTIPLEESPRIRLYADDADLDWVDVALAFYKQDKFDKQARVRVTIQGQARIDTGGVRRQFFSVVFSSLAASSSHCFFDGPANRLRPAFK